MAQVAVANQHTNFGNKSGSDSKTVDQRLNEFESLVRACEENRKTGTVSLDQAYNCCAIHRRLLTEILGNWQRSLEVEQKSSQTRLEQYAQLDRYAKLSKIILPLLPYVNTKPEEAKNLEDYISHIRERWIYAALLNEFGLIHLLKVMDRDSDQLAKRKTS